MLYAYSFMTVPQTFNSKHKIYVELHHNEKETLEMF